MGSIAKTCETQISAGELQAAAEKIKNLRLAATEHAIEIGRELLRVKEKLPHGAFVRWVERACDFKIRTAQDLMKLARETKPDAKLVALMVPSTLRVYLSRKTPPAVRASLLQRLENGDRVSRSDLYSQLSKARETALAPASCPGPASRQGSSASFMTLDLRAGAEGRAAGPDQARAVAELLLRRLSPDDYALIMEELNWETWNRVFVWMRAARVVDAERAELALPSAPPGASLHLVSSELQ